MPKLEASQRPVNGKSLWAWFTSKSAARHAADLSKSLAAIVDAKAFHSIQEWRRSDTGKRTVVYAFTAEDLESLMREQERKIARAARNTRVPSEGKLCAGEPPRTSPAPSLRASEVRVREQLDVARKKLEASETKVRDLAHSLYRRDEAIHKLALTARLDATKILDGLRARDSHTVHHEFRNNPDWNLTSRASR